MQLTQLIYVSVLVDRDESVLGPIFESSVRLNLQIGITGMLLYADATSFRRWKAPMPLC